MLDTKELFSDIINFADQLDRELLPRDNRALYTARMAYYFGFYFYEGYKKESREAALTIAKEYWEMCGHELKWKIHPKSFRWSKISKNYTLDKWASAYSDEDWAWQMIFHSGKEYDEAPVFQICGTGNSLQTHKTSNLWLTMSVQWFIDNPQYNPLKLYQHWAEILQADFGNSGIGLLPPHNAPMESKSYWYASEFGQMFPGADLCDPRMQIYGIVGVDVPNWLNLINEYYIEQLGGIDFISKQIVGTSACLYPYNGGVIIAAGEKPQLTEKGEFFTVPEDYKVLSAILKPIRAQVSRGFWGYHKEESHEWLDRFD